MDSDEWEVTRTIDAYFAALDRRDFARVESCFGVDATATYDAMPGKPGVKLVGADVIANWLRVVESFSATSHARSSMRILVEGDDATADVLATAHLVKGDVDRGRVLVRGVRYKDRLRRQSAGRWVIVERRHEPLWQYELETQPRALPPRQ